MIDRIRHHAFYLSQGSSRWFEIPCLGLMLLSTGFALYLLLRYVSQHKLLVFEPA